MDAIEFDPFSGHVFLDFPSKQRFNFHTKTAIVGVSCGKFFVFRSASPGPHYSFRWSNFTPRFNDKAFIFWGVKKHRKFTFGNFSGSWTTGRFSGISDFLLSCRGRTNYFLLFSYVQFFEKCALFSTIILRF